MAERVAVVTGGTRGIGAAISRMLKDKGYKVAATYAGNDEAAKKFKAETGINVYKFDVGDFAACQSVVGQIEKDLGAVDILINNAGITRDSTLRKMDRAQWDEVLDVNLGSAFNLCCHAIAGMQARGFGRVVNISSVSGQTGNFGQTNYAAAKAGLHGFTMSLAREVATRGITVNSVSPGYIRTPMTGAMPVEIQDKITASIPAGRMGQPDDIARTVAFLTDDAAGYITGANIPVNGGLFMSF